MNSEIQAKIAQLEEKGWTLAALADELAVSHNAVEKWKAGDRNPTNGKAILMFLESLANKKRVPKKRRYASSNRRITNVQGENL